MIRSHDQRQRLDELMRAAHGGRAPLELGRNWQNSLMGDIASRSGRPGLAARLDEAVAAFTGILFRFACAGAVVAAVLLVYAHFQSPDLNGDAARMLLEQPVSPAVLQALIWS